MLGQVSLGSGRSRGCSWFGRGDGSLGSCWFGVHSEEGWLLSAAFGCEGWSGLVDAGAVLVDSPTVSALCAVSGSVAVGTAIPIWLFPFRFTASPLGPILVPFMPGLAS